MFENSAFKISKKTQIPAALQQIIPDNKFEDKSIYLFFETLYESLPKNGR
ncbi:MAG: hypothetical protein Tsb005_20570 [Gammaproteobacteria bacterium]